MQIQQNLRLDKQLCFALYSTTNAITRAYRHELEKHGITYLQYLALIVLWESDGVSIKHIAERLDLDTSTLSPLLKRIENNGLVTRKRNDDDERIVNIFLTEQGKALSQPIAKIQQTVANQSGLNESEFKALIAQLKVVADHYPN